MMQQQLFHVQKVQEAGQGKNLNVHPLCDQLQYVAGDFAEYGGRVTVGFRNDPEEPYRNYIKLLNDWCQSKFAHLKAIAVLKYVKKRSLIRDLIADKILFVGEDRKFLRKGERQREKGAKDIFSVVTSQEDSFIRWIVDAPGELETTVWNDKTLWDSWIQYYFSKKRKRAFVM
jgi:CRISPR-associated protein Csd1